MNTIRRILFNPDPVRAMQAFQVFRFCGIFLTGILLVKSGISIDAIGAFETFLFLSGALSFFWVNGFMNALTSQYRNDQSEKDKQLLSTTAGMLVSGSLITVLALYFFRDAVQALLPAKIHSLFPLLIAFIFLNNTAFLAEYILLLKRESKALLNYGFASFILHVCFATIPVWMGYEIYHSVLALCSLALIRNAYTIALLKKHSSSIVSFARFREQLQLGIPLMLSLLLSGSAEYIDGFLISTHFGADAFAVFRYGAKEFPLSVLLSAATSTALVSHLSSENINLQSLGKLKSEAGKLIKLLFPLSILLLILSPIFYPLLFSHQFSESSGIFNLYLLLLISRMLFPQTIVMALGGTGIIFRFAILEILVNIISSYFLMLHFGMKGVALGTLIAFLTEKVCLSSYLHIKHGIRLSSYLPVKLWLGFSALLLLIYLISATF